MPCTRNGGSITGMHRLYPQPTTEVGIAEVYGSLHRRRPQHRPWVSLCMVTSIDAATARNAGVAVWLLPYGYNMGQPVQAGMALGQRRVGGGGL